MERKTMKIFVFTMCIIMLLCTFPMHMIKEANAQITVTEEWVARYDGFSGYDLISDIEIGSSGNIYLTDKDGHELEGWMPRKTGGQNICAPFHIRISGRDCMISIRKDGTLYGLNRRSNVYDGFPVTLNSEMGNIL